MKSSPSIWHLLHNVKSTVKISSNFVAFLENINFKRLSVPKKSLTVNIYFVYYCSISEGQI